MIQQIFENKKQFIGLLLLADEEEAMIDKYLNHGDMFVMYVDGKPMAVCVVTGENIVEIKNLAVLTEFQNKGYGRKFITFIEDKYKCNTLLVGTGDSPLTIPFYKKCGFAESYRVKDFFVNNYKKPIYEAGVQLKDMVCLEKQVEKEKENYV